MNTSNWDDFSNLVDAKIAQKHLDDYKYLDPSMNNINKLWKGIHEAIIEAADEIIPTKYILSNKAKPPILVKSYHDIKTITSILQRFKTSLISQLLWPNSQEWHQFKQLLSEIIKRNN